MAHFTIGAANARREELAQLMETFKGHVVRCPKGKPLPVIGKGRRTADTRTHGNFKPRRGSILTPDVFASGCMLIPR